MNAIAEAVQEQQPAAMVVRSGPSLVEKTATRFGVDASKLLTTLKATAFRQRDDAPEVTNEQMMALLVVADQYGLNPFTKEIYAFADRQAGIVPVVGVDGWVRIANQHPNFDGLEIDESDQMVTLDGAKPCPAWMAVRIYRTDRQHPIVVREYLDEVYQGPRKGFAGPWQTHTKRMLRHKTMIQGFRIAFGFAGIYDEDEAERVIVGQVIDGHVERDPAASLAESLRGGDRSLPAPAETAQEPQNGESTPAPPEDPPATQKAAQASQEPAQPEEKPATATDSAAPSANDVAAMIERAANANELDVCRTLLGHLAPKERARLTKQIATRAAQLGEGGE